MCDPVSIGMGVAGLGLSYYGQRQQQKAMNNYNNAQDALRSRQKALALTEQQNQDVLQGQKNLNVVDEAAKMTAAEPRVQALRQAEDVATQSNVRALEQANAIGVNQSDNSGHDSEAYLQAKADAVARQQDSAIKLARLFGQSGAINGAMQSQATNALENTLKEQALKYQSRQSQRGYELQNDLLGKQSAGLRYDSSAGQLASGLGGMFMQAGMSGIGAQAGGGKGVFDGLFSPSRSSPVF